MKRIVIIIWLLFGVHAGAISQSLDEYLKVASENNPELRAYFNEYLASLEKVPQVGALPDPELTVGFFLRPMERFMGNQQADIQLMQMFPWFGLLRTQKDEASKMALAQYEVFKDARYRLFYQVKNVWYQLYRLEEEIRITEESLAILKQYERLALIRFQTSGTGSGSGTSGLQESSTMNTAASSSSASSMGGMSSGMSGSDSGKSNVKGSSSMGTSSSMSSNDSGMSDVLRVKIEIKELESRLALLEDSRGPLRAEFNQLLNRKPDAEVSVVDSLSGPALTLERQILLDSITRNNPMLKMLDAEQDAYEVQKKMARLESRPMLGVGVNYMPFSPRTENGMSMGGDDMVMPMVRVSIPIYRKRYNALQKEAELRQLAAQERRENTVNLLTTQWSSALRDLDDAYRRTKLYKEQTELASQALNLLMTRYATDGRDFEDVLRVQQQLLDYKMKLITSIVDQHTSVALLESLAATELN